MSDESNPNAGADPANAAAGGATPKSWVDSLPETGKGFAVNKGWDSPEKAVQSYIELEKFVGADKAGRGVILPGDKATPEEISAFRAKLGVPADAAGYEIKLPDGFPDPEFGKIAAPLMHKHGIPKAAAEGLMADFVAQVAQGETARAAAEQAEFVKQETALKTEWGADFDKNTEIAKRGMKGLGFTDEVIDQIEAKAGFSGVLKAMHKAGLALGEGSFVDNTGQQGGFGETLDHLNAKRMAMYSDPAWAARFHANDPSARNEAKALEDKIAAHRAKLGA